MAFCEFKFMSKALGKLTAINVILPETKKPRNGWKTIVLLHGWSGDHTDWMRNTSIERYAMKRDLAVIMPDGEFSFYNDMANGLKYETFITKELPEICNKYFGTSLRREDNFIGGLSMGGCGALTLGLTHSEQYKAIICLSATNFPADGFQVQYKNHPWPGWLESMKRIYGDLFPNLIDTKYDAFWQAKRIIQEGAPIPTLFHYMGENEGPSVEWTEKMKEFFLSFEGNPFNYKLVMYPGIHNWDAWDAHIEEGLDYVGLKEVKRKK